MDPLGLHGNLYQVSDRIAGTKNEPGDGTYVPNYVILDSELHLLETVLC
jgi:hypothetical protein